MDKKTEAESAEEIYPGPTEFVHLHSHTVFSSLDGIAQPREYFEECSNRKWPAMGITEHGVLSSIPDAFWAAKEFEIKYIPGVELYYNDFEPKRQELASRGMAISKAKLGNDDLLDRIRRNRHLTVLCKNMTGYQNLLKINASAWENGFYYRPRTWFEEIAKHRDGLIILSGCLNGPLAHELRTANSVVKYTYMQYFEMFNEVFGDDYYIELQMPGIDDLGNDWNDVMVFERLVELAYDHGKKCVMTNDSHYMKRQDYILQKTMMAIAQGTTVDDPELFHVNSDEQYFKTRAELRKTFFNGDYKKVGIDVFEKACDNSLEIAGKCDNFKPNLDPKLPTVPDADTQLAIATYKALKKRNLHKNKDKYLVDGQKVTYFEQMEIELHRFVEKGFSSYFLIMSDLVDYAKSLHGDDSIGPARGSAGGSLVCYLLGIHGMDPLKWKLSFDRFLSPARGGDMLKVMM